MYISVKRVCLKCSSSRSYWPSGYRRGVPCKWPGFDPVPACTSISAENGFFSNSASGSRLSSTVIEIINMLKFAIAKAKVTPPLEAWVQRRH
jgi:hypothetical protein